MRKLSIDTSATVRTLGNVTEQRVLKCGLVQFQQLLVTPVVAANITAFPKKENGQDRIMAEAFFRRLLSGEVEFKRFLKGDMAAAQSELCHLSTEQQLLIRCSTLDFATESQSHEAHLNFLAKVDKHLFENLATRCIRKTGVQTSPQLLHALGFRITLVLGAIDVLAWDCHEQSPKLALSVAKRRSSGFLPPHWCFRLDETLWGGARLAIFHTTELWVQIVPAEILDIGCFVAGVKHVAVIIDRSTGIGKDRMLHWEISLIDPRVDDVWEELDRSKKKMEKQEALAGELTEIISKRSNKSIDIDSLDALTPEKPTRKQATGELMRMMSQRSAKLNDLDSLVELERKKKPVQQMTGELMRVMARRAKFGDLSMREGAQTPDTQSFESQNQLRLSVEEPTDPQAGEQPRLPAVQDVQLRVGDGACPFTKMASVGTWLAPKPAYLEESKDSSLQSKTDFKEEKGARLHAQEASVSAGAKACRKVEDVSPLRAEGRLQAQDKANVLSESGSPHYCESGSPGDEIVANIGDMQELMAKQRVEYYKNLESSVRGWVEAVSGWQNKDQSFAEYLKDGQVLCALANAVRPGMIKKVHNSKLAFKQMENATFFMNAARELGVVETSLFATRDLYEERNMDCVLACLYVFAGVVQVACPDFAGPRLGNAIIPTEKKSL